MRKDENMNSMVPQRSVSLENKMVAIHLTGQVVRAGVGGSFNLSHELGNTFVCI